MKIKNCMTALTGRIKSHPRVTASVEWAKAKAQTKHGQFLFFFFSEFISFFIIVAQTRFIANASYLGTIATDLSWGFQAWAVHKITVEHKEGRTWYAGLGSTLGGTLGSVVSLYVSKHYFKGLL